MTSTPASRPRPRAVFTEGSTLRHLLVMTLTGSIGLMAIFVVEMASLLYISWLGDPALTAGVGFASQVMFFPVSINIGLSIGLSALVSRAIGAGDRLAARRAAATGLALTFVVSCLVTAAAIPYRVELLEALGARGASLAAGVNFLDWTLPTLPVMSLGMVLPGLLRAVGDARRSMYVTLFGAMAVLVIDPVLILWMNLGVTGAAIAVNVSRCVWVVTGLWGAIRVHDMIARPDARAALGDFVPLMRVAFPAILTNLASPVAMAFSVRVMSGFGESAVAAVAIIDRLVPVAFGALFAMSGVVGPIIGQNYGARLFGRVRDTLTNCFALSAIYVMSMWLSLWLASPGIVWLFGAKGETAALVTFFCEWGAATWAFLGCLFAANAAFNNLDYAFLSTFFNWGRATLGTIPFVTLGARYFGAQGVIMGTTLGAAVFGLGAIFCAYWIAGNVEKKAAGDAQMS